MKLKVKQASDSTAEFEVMPGFVVSVRQLGTEQRAQLRRLTVKQGMRNPKTGELDEKFDEAAWFKHAPGLYLAGWRGLTISHLRRMIATGLDEYPELVDGQVPFDVEIAQGLFEHAAIPAAHVPPMPNHTPGRDANFGVVIQHLTLQVEAMLDSLEELRKNGLDGSASTFSDDTSRPTVTNVSH